MRSELFTLAVAAASMAAVSGIWTMDGGGPYRTSVATVPIDTSAQAAHVVYTVSSNVEDTVSEIEEFLLQSPLITSKGKILVVADNCSMHLLNDPSSLAAGADWKPIVYSWNPSTAIADEKEFAGVALSDDDVAFILDRRNRAIHAVSVSQFGFTEKAWSPVVLNVTETIDFDLDVSMLVSHGSMQLWIPLRGNLEGAEGVALVMDITDANGGAHSVVPLPDSDCRYPGDYGSALVDNGAVAIMSDSRCGLVFVNSDLSFRYKTYPTQVFEPVAEGVHTHPVFDQASNQLYFVDYSTTLERPQKVCCLSTTAYGACGSWGDECKNIPALSFDISGPTYYRWDFMGLALYKGILYLSASSTTQDKVIIDGRQDLHSAVFAFDASSGALLGQYRFDNDMINSPPLVVTRALGGTGRVYMTTTLGNVMCFDGSGSGISRGPLWTSPDLVPIPDDDLPASTYSFLTASITGTLLVTSTAGGKDWADEKVVYAIVNGLRTPPSAAASGLSAGAAAGIAITVTVLSAFGGFMAYQRVDAFRTVVDGSMAAVKKIASSAGVGGGGSGAEKSGLLKSMGSSSSGGGGGGTGGGATAPTFSNAYNATA